LGNDYRQRAQYHHQTEIAEDIHLE